MQRLILWGSVAGLASCLLKPQLVAITPDYGYVDGCIDVTLSGHKLGETATAKIGTLDLELTASPNDPNIEDYKEDVGFEYTAQVGAAPEGAGWYDVTMTVDGEELVLKNGFYFRSCPATVHLDIFDAPPDPDPYAPGHPLTAGEQLVMQGCGITDQVTVEFVDISGVPPARPAPPRPKGPALLPATPPPTGDTGTPGTPTGDTGTGTPTPTGDTGTPPTPTGDTGTTGGSGTGGSGTTLTDCTCNGTVVATAPIESECLTAQAHAVIPTLPEGSYCVRAVHPDGTQVPVPDHYAYNYYYYCSPPAIFTVGGAR